MTGVNPCAMHSSKGAVFTATTSPTKPGSIFSPAGPVSQSLRQVKISALREPARFALEQIDSAGDFRIDLAREHLIHHFNRGFICDPHALDKIRLQPGRIHGAGDRLASAVNNHRIDARRFKENHVTRDSWRVAMSGESMKLPPYLITNVWLRNRCR